MRYIGVTGRGEKGRIKLERGLSRRTRDENDEREVEDREQS
jgi:hypothetical protein